jgi:Raf kinase inhibitor-like YbhB/YbcL family protein
MKKIIALITILFLIACAQQAEQEPTKEVAKMKLSSVFENNQPIPTEYTCDGDDKAPALTVEDAPAKTKTLALIVDDPDAPAGTWVHWVEFNIAPTAEIKPGAGTQGTNDFKKLGYGGPCPPSGTHRYFFKLYALDTELSLEEGSSKADVEKAMKDHILEKTELIGTYSR